MKLSVLLVTYNHESYIGQALDSILMQQTDFEYEIVVGEDFSTDNTREILLHYQSSYPDRIKLILRDSNIGACLNFIDSYKQCTGEYIAYLDGDDYWTAADKLQKQVDFLDTNQECSICCHAVRIVPDNDQDYTYVYRMPSGRIYYSIKDLLDCNCVPNCTTLFRNGLIKEFPEWYYKLKQGDWSLHLLNAEHGNIGYIDEEMSTYRSHNIGAWNGMSLIERNESIIETYEAFNKHLKFTYDEYISNKLVRHYLELLDHYYYNQDKAAFAITVARARAIVSKTISYSISYPLLLLGIWCYAPRVFIVLRYLKRVIS